MNVSNFSAADLSVNIPLTDFEDWIIDPKPITRVLTSVIGQTNKNAPFLAPDLVNLVVEYVKNTSMFIFGEKDWKQHFGEVSSAPALPLDIEAILQSVKHRCMLIYIPSHINEQMLSLSRMKMAARKKLHDSKSEKTFHIYVGVIEAMHLRLAPALNEDSHWSLITEEVLTESLGKSYEDQKACVEGSTKEWHVVCLRDVVISTTVRNIIGKKRLYGSLKTRCSNEIEGGYPTISSTDNDKNNVEMINIKAEDSNQCGVAAMRRFF